MIKRASRVAALTLTVLFVAGCGGDDGPEGISIRNFIAAVSWADGNVDAVFKSGTPPGSSGGPSINVSGAGSVIAGSSYSVSVSSATEFTTVTISISGVDGYWEITLPNTTLANLLLAFSTSIPRTTFDVAYKAATSGGAVGPQQVVPTAVVPSLTGQVQVSVSWDTPSDVDLHLVEPSGEEIYYANGQEPDTSATGGQLDVDSNAGCSVPLDNINNENISWTGDGVAPRGEYIVRVNYYLACGVTSNTNYVVTVRVQGQSTRTFTGSFTPNDADEGAQGAGREIYRFTF